jgi:hypothetical protein
MSSDQCAQNPDGSLKDPQEIQWFNDADDTQPLPSTTTPAQPLGRGHRNKTTNRFFDAVAREQLDSDEDVGTFIKPSKRKRAARTSNISGGPAPAALCSSNSFEMLPVEESSDDDEDDSFKSDSGGKSGEDPSDESMFDAEPISNAEVRVQPFSHDIECLPDIVAACRCSTKEDGCES